MGSSTNDVTFLGGQEFCDNSTEASVIICVTMGEDGLKISKIVWRHLMTTQILNSSKCVETITLLQIDMTSLMDDHDKAAVNVANLIVGEDEDAVEPLPEGEVSLW